MSRLDPNRMIARLHADAGRPAAAAAVALLVCGCLAGGCQPRSTHFDIVDYPVSGEPTSYFQEFDECYYDIDAQGNVEIVARQTGPLGAENDSPVTQVIYLSGIWRAVPGTTEVESTQLNATIRYWIRGQSGGVGFEGGGFVVFSENYKQTKMSGHLELSDLQLTRQVGTPPLIFERLELTGKFRAERDERWAVRIINSMERYFGPMPRYEPPPPGPM